MSDSSLMNQLLNKRTVALESFKSNRVGEIKTADRFREILDDLVEMDIWMEEAGKRPTYPPRFDDSTEREQIELYFAFMRKQRIGVQRFFTEKKQLTSLFNAKTVYQIIGVSIDALVIIIMFTALLVGLEHMLALGMTAEFLKSIFSIWTDSTSTTNKLPNTNTLIAAGAVSAAFLAGLRAFSQGSRLREESERYNWYEAAVREIEQDFDNCRSDSERFSALLHLETAAYRETRAFLVSHQSARFLVD